MMNECIGESHFSSRAGKEETELSSFGPKWYILVDIITTPAKTLLTNSSTSEDEERMMVLHTNNDFHNAKSLPFLVWQ